VPEHVSAESYVAPRTPVEEVLAGILQELLHVERVGVRDNFFALGGHSLLATQVISRLQSVLAVDGPPGRLFQHPTVRGGWVRGRRGERQTCAAEKACRYRRCCQSGEMNCCRCRLHNSDCGSSSNWNRRALPTMCRPACD